MKQKEILLLSNEDLTKRLKDLKDQMVSLKLTHKMAPIENPMRITGLRKIIARLSTELTVRQNTAKAEN
ncbi:MAG: 50S ribosomal protein L29 [Flavobacteriia bacterium]|jgi:large subunit ribosomal protein L29|nr:50S ribosomal protein L29 [Flavobacteriia bacterium]